MSSDWRELCEQASMERDSERLLQLTAEISRLLDEQRSENVSVVCT